MEIDYIYLRNFRQYQDAKIEFAKSPDVKFTIIQGANGAGKTNLLNAITWCLFGEELHVDSKYKGLPVLNTTTLDEVESGILELKVEMQLIQSDGKRILITRQKQYKKGKERNPIEVPQPHTLSIMREKGRDWVGPIYGDDAQYIIDGLIPPSIEEYFFFDGERMDDYFTETTRKEIRKAVFKISQLELLETMIDHLTKRRNDFLKTARGLSSEAEGIREMIQIQSRSLDTDKEELEELTAKEIEAKQKKQFYSEKLRGSSLERVQSLEDQRVDLDNDLSRIQEEIEEIEAKKLELLHSNMPAILCYDALLKTKQIIDGRREAGLIPPRYRAIFIKGLLNKGKCICGSDITEKDEYSLKRRKTVEQFLEISKLSEMSNEIVETNTRIAEMLGNLTDFPNDVVDLGKKLRSLQETKSGKNEKIKRITQEIEQSNVENIRKWEKEKQKFTKEQEQLAVKIALKKRDIERRSNIIRAYNIKLNQELKKQTKHSELLNRLAFCDGGMRAAQDIKELIMKKVKDEIEEKTSQQFLNMIWKKRTYECVKIDDNYNISVPHVSGREALGTLSAGERQVCALSFMAALNSVSGFKVPIVIDTLLARISSEPRKSIAENLPGYLEGTQVTLLVTEEEYTPQVKKALSKSVGKMYEINFIEKERGGLAEVNLVR